MEEYDPVLHGLPIDQIFSLSDLEDLDEEGPSQTHSRNDNGGGEDVDMDS